MAPTKVAFVTPGSFAIPSANSSSVERVVEKFVPLLAPHIEPRIYGRASSKLPRTGSLEGVVCERFPAADKSAYMSSVGRAIRRFAPQIIQVENRPRAVPVLKRMNPRKTLWLNLHSSTFIGPRYISAPALRRSLMAADKIIVNSEHIRGKVLEKAPGAAGKISVVYPGVDTSRFVSQHTPEGAYRREEQRLLRGLSGRKVVIFIGRLIPLKGAHHLLNVVPELAKAHPELLAVIVGSPFYGSHRKTAYARKLEALGRSCPEHVRFVPYVPHNEVPDWFVSSDIAVVPSGEREAFGLVNVEAMACGVPVVATYAGGMKEIIHNGLTGFLIDPQRLEEELAARLRELLEDAPLREWMGRRSRELVEHKFTWRHTAGQWLQVLRESGFSCEGVDTL